MLNKIKTHLKTLFPTDCFPLPGHQRAPHYLLLFTHDLVKGYGVWVLEDQEWRTE